MRFSIITLIFFLTAPFTLYAADGLKMDFQVAMDNPSLGTYQVLLSCSSVKPGYNDFKIPVWMPGYYQIMDYADDITGLSVSDAKGTLIKWEKANHNTWRVYNGKVTELILNYKVKTKRSFVATNYLAADRGFIAPTGLFLHIDAQLNTPITLSLKPPKQWTKVATGLTPIKGKAFTYTAPDFDTLYDSPILIGMLDELPTFEVKGIPHYFIGYQLGEFKKQDFINDLQKVITAAVEVIGEVPFKDYTFIGIGQGGGGIEHLNSTAVAFSGGSELNTPEGRKGMLSFLGHEYFHHYNAKRIRPIALGPFDYDNGSRTNMLWVAEGVTSYYDKMLLRRAGLESVEGILNDFESSIRAYENSPGRYFQTVSQASYDTWSDGPFGRVGDELNKTISYYQKGPVLAMMLDFKIRHETGNKKSLDDVMRALYYSYYKKLGRGYTDEEFQAVCEKIAGGKLDEFFNYVYTLHTPDYSKYLAYAGLEINLSPNAVAGAWLGAKVRKVNNGLEITDVDWESPAWKERMRRKQIITKINGETATIAAFNAIGPAYQPGAILRLTILKEGSELDCPVILGTKKEASFKISQMQQMDTLQKSILKDWLRQ
ncbi:M61 family metallopeptidase [Pedobacter sp. GSP4]|uniref:M61 family metallopeptidase n=1 Tax=Pedobacter sp. GSP4 TaxID=3453716 RepID=UPI003EEBBD37